MEQQKDLMARPEGEVAVLTLEEFKKKEIKKFSLPDKKIAALKATSLAIKVSGIEDKEGYKALTQQLTLVRTTRTGIEKKRVELKAMHLEVGKAIDGEAKRLTAMIEEFEPDLIAQKKEIDDAVEFKANEKKRIEEELINSRINTMIAMGMAFDGAYYSIGENLSLSVVEVRAMSEDNFNSFLERVSIESEKEAEQEKLRKDQDEKDRIERDRLQKIEDDRIKAQQEENERLRKQNEESQKQIQEQQRQMQQQSQDLENQRLQMYANDLRGIGFQFFPNWQTWSFVTPAFGKVDASISDLKNIELTKWAAAFQAYKDASLAIHNQQISWNDAQTKQAEENRIANEKKQAEAREKQEREKQEREDRLRPDIDKAKIYFANIYAIALPTIQTPEIIDAFNALNANMTAQMVNFEKTWDKQ